MFYVQDLSENITQLDIYNVTKQVIYSVPINQINMNDVVQITGSFEATNPYSYNVMIGSWIILGDSSKSTSGVLIDCANSFNITPNMHHGIVAKARNWQASSTYYNKYVNLVGWAASVDSLNGHSLKIEQQYGHLDVLNQIR